MLNFLQEKKKQRTDLVMAYYPFDDAVLPKLVRARKEGPRPLWKQTLHEFEFSFTDPTKVRLWMNSSGEALILCAPYGVGVGSPHPAQLKAARLTPVDRSGLQLKRVQSGQAARTDARGNGTDMLRDELLLIAVRREQKRGERAQPFDAG